MRLPRQSAAVSSDILLRRKIIMKYGENEIICKCKKVSLADIERVLHDETRFEDVEAEFDKVQKVTHCSTGCGRCHNKIMGVISEIMNG